MQEAHLKRLYVKRLSVSVPLPAAAVAILISSIFGITPIWMAFKHSLGHNVLSGNALNFNWPVAQLLRLRHAARFGGLVGGQATYIVTRSPEITLIPRLLFVLSYIITVVSFFKRDKSFENMILFSLLGYLAYFTFNVGVHENHLFLASILSAILFWVNKRHLPSMVIVILMTNINLVIFYGIDGMGLRFSRAIGGRLDTDLLLSLFNVSFFAFFWVANVLLDRNSVCSPGEASRAKTTAWPSE